MNVRTSGTTAAAAGAAAAALLLSGCSVLPAHGYGLIDGGRLEKCRGDVPCVSTSSVGSPGKFGAPWTFSPETNDFDTAWESLKGAVETNELEGKIVELEESASMPYYYMRAEFPGFIRGIDDLEFKLVKEDKLVTYRSSSREAIFVYPIQTPVDGGRNRARLLNIRNKLGWVEDAAFSEGTELGLFEEAAIFESD